MTNTTPSTPTPIRKQYNKQQLCEMLSLSERTLENMVNAGSFPPPVRIGKYVYWSENAVLTWQQNLFFEQENWSQKVTKGVDLGYLGIE
ncbi:helix-turn-helix transcriptional regulator [Paenalcaligenes hominis]|uniref:helix-turn-helix transcriptional regulator n=1 Tax=Paenalcaligenes hominis TaxID=643674 RepID=UPI00352634BB